jgi:hypothetical protein
MPNGTAIQLSYTSDLLLNELPHEARKVHGLPVLVHNSLIYVGQLCDSGSVITFTREKEEVIKDNTYVMSGLRNPQLRLWRVTLKEDAKPACKS